MVKEVTSQTQEAVTADSLFIPAKQALKKRGAKVFVWGSYGVGKTFFSLSFPEPIDVISTEDGVSLVALEKAYENKNIRIMECTRPFAEAPISKKTGKADEGPGATDPLESLKTIEQAVIALKGKKEGTIVVDSISDIWSWMGTWLEYNADKYTKSGQMMRTEWGKANARYTWIIRKLLSLPVNVVFTSRSANVYDGSGQMTDREKFKAQQETPYHADIIIHLTKNPVPNIDPTGKVTGTKMQRTGIIEKCRGADLNLSIQDPTFDKLKEALKDKIAKEVFQ